MYSLIRLEDKQISEDARLRKSCAILVDFIPSVTLNAKINGF